MEIKERFKPACLSLREPKSGKSLKRKHAQRMGFDHGKVNLNKRNEEEEKQQEGSK